MRNQICLIVVGISVGVQGCSLPAHNQALVASQQIREDKQRKQASVEAPDECLTIARAFISYIFRKEPDIANDKEAQNRWLTEHLRKGLAHRQDVYRTYAKNNFDTPEESPSNKSFVGAWDYPTSYSIQGSRLYGDRAIVDILFAWGEQAQYAGDTRLVSYVFIHEGNAWKLDDIYTFRGEFVGASSLSESFGKNAYP